MLGRREVDGLGEIDRCSAQRVDDRKQGGQREQHRFDELAEIFGDHGFLVG
jgi:hypothetical protein